MPKRSYGGRAGPGRSGGFWSAPRRYRSALAVPARSRGFLRTGGYYGRFRGRRASNTGPELKFFDTALSDASVAADGVVQGSLNLIPQGVTESTRVGRKCVIKNLNFRLTLYRVLVDSVATALPHEQVRIMLVLDKQANGANPAITDILETDDMNSFNNLANKSRFRVLYDKVFNMDALAVGSNGTTVDQAARSRTVSCFKKVNLPIEFSSTTGAITEIRSNNLVWVTVTDTGSLTTINGTCRVRFSDG